MLRHGQCRKRVIVVDQSLKIGGEGSVPHDCIGRARRMPVPRHKQQHTILIEAIRKSHARGDLCPLCYGALVSTLRL